MVGVVFRRSAMVELLGVAGRSREPARYVLAARKWKL
jgi:hypothetical protein